MHWIYNFQQFISANPTVTISEIFDFPFIGEMNRIAHKYSR